MHHKLDVTFDLHEERIGAAWERVSQDATDGLAWQALGEAACGLEADSVLAGEYSLAYVASKLDRAVQRMIDGSLPPSAMRMQEVSDFLGLLNVARAEWLRSAQGGATRPRR